ncbi:hypothetical protein pVa21_092 [Vibrio phage pVa-21]|nr:hypothetical protein pVa21_092 [Vibrio phage pVa-21]
MTNVITHDFGFRDPNGYDPDNRFDVGTTGLIMTVDWLLKVYQDAAMELFHEHDEHEIAKLFPVFEVFRTVYQGILIPFKVTSGITIRRDRTVKKNYSIFGLHYPLDSMKDVEKLKAQGKEPDPEFQVEVTYGNYEDDFTEETMFGNTSTQVPPIPDGCVLHSNYYHALITNINTVVANHGGFSRATEADDANKSPALIGFIPYSGANYIRISLVITNKSK